MINNKVAPILKMHFSPIIVTVHHIYYRNVPMFLDRQVWANSVDPDQTARPRGAVCSGSTLLVLFLLYDFICKYTVNAVSLVTIQEVTGFFRRDLVMK